MPATRLSASISITPAAQRVPTSAWSSLRYWRTPTSGSSISCCVGRWIASAAKAWCPRCFHLQRLASYRVGFHSYTEPMLSTDNEMVRDIVLAVMASLAKIERQKISDRTRAGMDRVRRQGSKSGMAIGRPRISAQTRGRIVEMLAAGTGIRATARAVGTGNETVHRIAREIRAGASG